MEGARVCDAHGGLAEAGLHLPGGTSAPGQRFFAQAVANLLRQWQIWEKAVLSLLAGKGAE